jgi:hypothetical protein
MSADARPRLKSKISPPAREAASSARSAGGELALTNRLQGGWSYTATILSRNIAIARSLTFALSVIAALFAAVAGQLPATEGGPRLNLAIASAVLLGVVGFLSLRLLGPTAISAWVRARAASEALKSEAYKYAASAAPYDSDTRDQVLSTERDKVAGDVDDLIQRYREARSGSAPLEALTRTGYIASRVVGQAEDYYMPKAAVYQRKAMGLHQVEFVLALMAAALTAATGVAGKANLFGVPFDFVSLTGVLTTLVGAILAHLTAANYDVLVTTYRVASRKLLNLAAGAKDVEQMDAGEWSGFVERCESIIRDENGSWVSKWTKPAS